MTIGRWEHVGGAAATGLAAPMGAADTSFTLLSGTGFPTGAGGKLFAIIIDPGLPSEEHIICSARSGATVTVNSSGVGGRGADNTVASSHATGTTNVQHALFALEVDDDNDHVYTTTRDDHTQYARTDGTRAFTGSISGTSASFTGAVTSASLTASGVVTASSFAPTAHQAVCRVSQAGAWNPTASAIFKFDTVEYDPTTMYSASTGVFTIPTTGVYAVKAALSVLTDGTHASSGSIQWKVGSSPGVVRAQGPNYAIPVSTTCAVIATSDLLLNSGDQLNLTSQLSAAAGETGVTGSGFTFACVHYVGPAT